MENKLPNPEDILEKEFPYFKVLVDDEVAYRLMIEVFKKYGTEVRDYTLEVASKNANVLKEWTIDCPSIDREDPKCSNYFEEDIGYEEYIPVSFSVNKDSILNLKNSKELEI